jgi:hypothetical protein
MGQTAAQAIKEKLRTPEGFVRLCKLIGYPEKEILECLVNDQGLSLDAARVALASVVVD